MVINHFVIGSGGMRYPADREEVLCIKWIGYDLPPETSLSLM